MKVLIFSGHTGGHLFPSISFAETFKTRYPQSSLILITTEKAQPFIQKEVKSLFQSVIFLQPFPSPSGLSLAWFAFALRLLKGFWDSFHLLSREKPDLVVGFGSYVSYPGVVIAKAKKIPVLIHEQNKIPGRATSWLIPYADKIATSFPQTFVGAFAPSKIVCVGLPLRSQILQTGGWEGLQKRTNDQSRLRLLVMGGSQGAKTINSAVLEAFSQLSDEEKKRLVVNHITGTKDRDFVEKKYKNLGIQAHIYPFFDRMDQIFSETDFAVSRAGANTLFELSFFGIPALLIPYPYAGEHQLPNAKSYEENGAAWVIREREINSEIILEKIRLMMNQSKKIREMANKMYQLAKPDAGKKLVDLAAQLMEVSK